MFESTHFARCFFRFAGLVSKETYGNNFYIENSYDNLDRVTERKYNGSSTNRATYLYGADGSLAQTVDYSVGTRTQFTYDLADRLVSQKEYATTARSGGALRSSTDFTYADKTNYLTGVKHFSPLGTQTIGYTYGNIGLGQMPDQIYKVSWNGQEKVNYTYDSLGRLTDKSVIVGGGVPDAPRLDTRYTYVNVGDSKTTTLVNSVQTAAGTFTYTYDEVGNIKTVSDGTYTTSYKYDDLNQLVRENNQRIGKTYTYAYQNGNITERKEYAYTTGELPEQPQYVYSWGYADSTWSDLMTSWGETGMNGSQTAVSTFSAEGSSGGDGKIESVFDRALAQRSGGVSLMNAESSTPAFTYDEIGNPTNILGIQFSWEGRQLTNVSLPNDPDYSNISYQYNIDGQRVSKTVTETDGTVTTTEYFYNGEILAGQKTGDTVVVFQYDNNNDYFGFTVDGRQYYYVKNNQNDVVAITNADGDIVARYYYDAWGNASEHYLVAGQESDDASLNPFLYRSYYMDDESGFYYLNTRYYISVFSRFLNADWIVNANRDVLGNNLFAYCSNDPVNNCDVNGCGKISNWFKNAIQTIKNWWNSTPPAHSYTVPASNQVIGMVSDPILGATANYTKKYSKTVTVVHNYTKEYSKKSTLKIKPFGETIRPYQNIAKVLNKVSAVITVASLALDLGNTWTENNGNTNGQRVIKKSAIQIGGVVAGIGVGAFAAAVTGPSILGVVVFVGITTAGGIAINQASQYLINKAGIE